MGFVKHPADGTSESGSLISGRVSSHHRKSNLWLKWLLPGRWVKRWLLVSGIGILLIGLGLGICLTRISMDWQQLALDLQNILPVLPSPASGAIAVLLGLFLAIWGQIRAATSMTDLLARTAVESRDRHPVGSVSSPPSPKVVLIGGEKELSGISRGLKYYRATITATVDLTTAGKGSESLKGKHPSLSSRFHSFPRENPPLPKSVNLFQTLGTGKPPVSPVSIIEKSTSPCPGTPANFPFWVASSESLPCLNGGGCIRDSMPSEWVRAIREADCIIVGPGSLYTHLIPNLNVPEIRDAIAQAQALRVYVCNLMTEPGETDGYTVAEHLRTLHDTCGGPLFDAVLVQRGSPSARSLMHYAQDNIHPVYFDREEVEELGCEVIEANVMREDEKTGTVHHHPQRLARVLLNWYEEHRTARSVAKINPSPPNF
ncbi:MAG: gluconeogenesis factor YvcK family protein [Limnospira sp.]